MGSSNAYGADANLRRNLSAHQLPHLSIGTDLPITSRASRIVDATNSHLERLGLEPQKANG